MASRLPKGPPGDRRTFFVFQGTAFWLCQPPTAWCWGFSQLKVAGPSSSPSPGVSASAHHLAGPRDRATLSWEMLGKGDSNMIWLIHEAVGKVGQSACKCPEGWGFWMAPRPHRSFQCEGLLRLKRGWLSAPVTFSCISKTLAHVAAALWIVPTRLSLTSTAVLSRAICQEVVQTVVQLFKIISFLRYDKQPQKKNQATHPPNAQLWEVPAGSCTPTLQGPSHYARSIGGRSRPPHILLPGKMQQYWAISPQLFIIFPSFKHLPIIFEMFGNHLWWAFGGPFRLLKLNGNDSNDQGQGPTKIIAMIRLCKNASRFDVVQVDGVSLFEALGIHSHWEPPVF